MDCPIRIFLPTISYKKSIILHYRIYEYLSNESILTSRKFPFASESRKYMQCKTHFPAAILPSIFSFLDGLKHIKCVALGSKLASLTTSPPRLRITCSYVALSCYRNETLRCDVRSFFFFFFFTPPLPRLNNSPFMQTRIPESMNFRLTNGWTRSSLSSNVISLFEQSSSGSFSS